MSTNAILSADATLISLIIDFEYMTSNLQSNATCTNLKHSPENSLMAETLSLSLSLFLSLTLSLYMYIHICIYIYIYIYIYISIIYIYVYYIECII